MPVQPYTPPTEEEVEELFAQITAHLKFMFDHTQDEADRLVSEYKAERARRQIANPEFHCNDELFHQGAVSMTYIIQWWIGLKGDLGSIAFLDWRKADYARRKVVR